MEHRECPNCGNDLLITEQRCVYCGSANPYYEAPKQKAVVPSPASSGTVYNGTLTQAHSSSTAAVDPTYATKYSTTTTTGTTKKSGAGAVICAIFVALGIGIKCFAKAFWFVFKWTAKVFWFILKGLFLGIAAIFKIIF